MMGPPGDDGDDGDEWQIPGPMGPAGTGSSSHAPTAKVGVTAVTGTALTFMTSDSAPALDLTFTPTMTGAWVFTPAAGVGITINAYTGTYALALSGADNTYTAEITGSATTGRSFGLAIVAGTNASDIPLIIESRSTLTPFLSIYGDGHATVTGAWTFNGESTFNAGTGTYGLQVQGVDSNYTCVIIGSTTSTKSYGLAITAGTTSADTSFLVQSSAGAAVLAKITGDGATYLYGPKIGFYTATPVVQVTGWGTPLNGTKLVSMNGTTTYTVVQLGACIAEILIVLKGLGLIGA